MTGQELFHALSFVDERYVQEADSAKLSAGIPWMKIVSVAACLCILFVGAFYRHIQRETQRQALFPDVQNSTRHRRLHPAARLPLPRSE